MTRHGLELFHKLFHHFAETISQKWRIFSQKRRITPACRAWRRLAVATQARRCRSFGIRLLAAQRYPWRRWPASPAPWARAAPELPVVHDDRPAKVGHRGLTAHRHRGPLCSSVENPHLHRECTRARGGENRRAVSDGQNLHDSAGIRHRRHGDVDSVAESVPVAEFVRHEF